MQTNILIKQLKGYLSETKLDFVKEDTILVEVLKDKKIKEMHNWNHYIF